MACHLYGHDIQGIHVHDIYTHVMFDESDFHPSVHMAHSE